MSSSSSIGPNDKKIKININQVGNVNSKQHQAKPVILQFDQKQQQNMNESLIKKMIKNNNSNIKYAGGYKNNSNASSSTQKPLYRPEPQNEYQINSSNVGQQLGISKQQPKYRIQEQKIPSQNYSMNALQSRIEQLKQDRQTRNNSILQPRDAYTLVNNEQRFQSVLHPQSSLDAITLENIEAKLEAHRRGMRNIQEQYNAKKGKNMPIDRYGYMKVNIDVDKEYSQMQGIDSDKMYTIAKKQIQMKPEEIQFQQLWEMKKKNDPKLAQYDAKYKQYLVSKGAKQLMGSVLRSSLYLWDKYTQPNHQHSKQKPKQMSRQSPRKQHSRSPQKQNHQQKEQQKGSVKLIYSDNKYGLDGVASIKDVKQVLETKDDKFISSYIFAQIDTNKVGLVSKEELHEYLLSQQHIINGYNIDTKWLFTDLDNFETKRKGMFNKTQLALFLATLEKLEHPKLILTNKSEISKEQKTGSAIVGETLKTNKSIQSKFYKFRPIFQKLFNTLDFNDDKLIKRTEFIENMYVDSDCVTILDEDVIKIKPISKSITVRQIIGFILDDYQKQRNQKIKKSKQYITFSRFCQYFDIPETLDLSKIDKNSVKKKEDQSTQYQVFDLPEQYLLLLKDIFNQIPRIYQDYIVSADFVQSALRDPQILALSDQLCRIESIQTKLPLQSLQSILHRMQKQCDQYSTWETLKLYFSRRGRPLDWDYDMISKKRQIRNKMLQQERKNLSKEKVRQTQNFFQLSDNLKSKSRQKIKRIPQKYTVPQPFDITDMKQKPKQQFIDEGRKQFDELKKTFKAAPINQQILQPKPDLILGKIAKKQKSIQSKNEYKYQNYENDRIQRALKRAQQQYQINQKIKQIKQKTEIKAHEIGVDLTKKYMDVIKQQKKKRQNSKYKPTQPKASESLYPVDPAGQKSKKIQKVKENIQKADQVAKRKNQQIQQDKKKAKQKNQQAKKLAQEAKKREKQQQKKRDEIATDGLEFKPKINKRQLTDKQKQQIQKGREERERKRKQEQMMRIQMEEQRRKKILGYDKKGVFLPIDGLTDDQILDKIDQINFQDLLFTQKQKEQYQKQFPSKNKTLKQLKQREKGLAGRERAAMQQQQKRIMEQKRKYKQQVQKQKTNQKQSFSKTNIKGQKAGAFKEDLNFHKSKALRRYRAIMDGKKPESEFDQYSVFSRDNKDNNRILNDQLEQQHEEENQEEDQADEQQN